MAIELDSLSTYMENKRSTEDKLKKLSERQEKLSAAINKFARGEGGLRPSKTHKEKGSARKQPRQVGWLDFASHIIAGGILGVILNDVFNAPILIAVCLVIGFISSLVYCYRNLQ